jgi:hypothetical protein
LEEAGSKEAGKREGAREVEEVKEIEEVGE